jgi:hypothetical protein
MEDGRRSNYRNGAFNGPRQKAGKRNWRVTAMKIKAVQYYRLEVSFGKNDDGALVYKREKVFTRYDLLYEENGEWVKVPVEFVEEDTEDGL